MTINNSKRPWVRPHEHQTTPNSHGFDPMIANNSKRLWVQPHEHQQLQTEWPPLSEHSCRTKHGIQDNHYTAPQSKASSSASEANVVMCLSYRFLKLLMVSADITNSGRPFHLSTTLWEKNCCLSCLLQRLLRSFRWWPRVPVGCGPAQRQNIITLDINFSRQKNRIQMLLCLVL